MRESGDSEVCAPESMTRREDLVVSAVATERQLLAKRLGPAQPRGFVNAGHFATYCVMRVRLVRKLADILDGIDVSAYKSGDIVNLSRHDAELLIAEEWAVSAEYAPLTATPSSPASDALLGIDQLNRSTVAPHHRRHDGMKIVRGGAHEPRAADRIRAEVSDTEVTPLQVVASPRSIDAEAQVATEPQRASDGESAPENRIRNDTDSKGPALRSQD